MNLDSNQDAALKALRATGAPWPNLYESGGFDSRFATDMGIFSLPIAVLLDNKGKVMSRSINVGELDTEIRKLAK